MKKTMMLMAAVALVLAGSLGAQAQNAETTKAASPLQLKFHHATISVANIEAMAGWYIEKLGFAYKPGEKIVQINPMMKGTRLVMPGFQLDLVQWKGSVRPQNDGNVLTQQGIAHLVFVTPDVEGTFNALKAAGIEVHANGRPGAKMNGFTFGDLEGNEIEVAGE